MRFAIAAPLVASGARLRQISAALAAAGTTRSTGQPLAATQVKRLVARLQEVEA